MAKNQSNRGGSRRSKNNNPEGRNQYSGFVGMARQRPATAAAAAAGVAAAGVFLWTKRAQISDQLADLSDQISEWAETMWADPAERELEMAGSDAGFNSRPAAAGSFGSATPSRSTATRPSAAKRPSPASKVSSGSFDSGPGQI